jgi:muramoyltetrapeptide carboxypeptidase
MTLRGQPLRPGDTVALTAPSGLLKEPALLERAEALLRGFGFQVRVGASCRAGRGYLAGDDALRAGDLNACFADPAVRAIVCLKGGYGVLRLLERLDYPAIARNPKALVGYSDITALHLALNQRCGLATLHGPMATSAALLEGDPYSVRSWLAALTSAVPLGFLAPPAGAPALRPLAPGSARGPLAGGNLATLAATLGTPFELDARGRILFLEDIDERPYKVDRMLTQLRLAGKFRDCAGILLGDWNNCVPDPGEASLSLEEVFQDLLVPAGKPILAGFPAGHCVPNATFPLGVEAVLDAQAGTVEVVEAALG